MASVCVCVCACVCVSIVCVCFQCTLWHRRSTRTTFRAYHLTKLCVCHLCACVCVYDVWLQLHLCLDDYIITLKAKLDCLLMGPIDFLDIARYLIWCTGLWLGYSRTQSQWEYRRPLPRLQPVHLIKEPSCGLMIYMIYGVCTENDTGYDLCDCKGRDTQRKLSSSVCVIYWTMKPNYKDD